MGDLDFYGDRGFLQTFCPAQHVQHAGYDFATTCSNQIVLELEQGEKLYTNWNMRQIQVKPSTAEENAFFEKGISFTGFLISSVIHKYTLKYSFENLLSKSKTLVLRHVKYQIMEDFYKGN